MPVDPSVILGVHQLKIPSAVEVMTLKDLAVRSQINEQNLQEKQMEVQSKNAILQIMKTPEMTNPQTGRLTPQGIAAITRIDPAKGIAIAHQEQQLSLQDMAFDEKRTVVKRNVLTSYVSAYDRYLQENGGDRQGAEQKARAEALGVIQEGKRSGHFAAQGFGANELEHELPPPEVARTAVRALGGTAESPKLEHVTAINPATPGKLGLLDPRSRTFLKDASGRFVEAPPNATMLAQTAGDVISPSQANLHGEEFLKTLPTGQAGAVKQVAEYRADPKTVSSLRVGQREALMARVAQFDPNFDQTKYAARAAVRKDFTSGKTALNITAMNTSLRHMGTLYELSDALQNGNVRTINEIVNRSRAEFGDPAINNAQTAQQAVSNELMRVFRQVQASESETRDWEKRFSTSQSPAAMKGALATGTHLLEGRLKELNAQWNRGMETNTGFSNIISPELQGIMAKVKGESQSKSNIQSLLDKYK